MGYVVKYLTIENVHGDDFEVVGGKLKIKADRIKPIIQAASRDITEYILEQAQPETTVQVIADANTKYLKMVAINGLGLGIISIDFIYRGRDGARTVAFRMPEGAPLPTKSITTNAGSGMLWWNAGSREIVFSQVTNGQRVVLNLVGMFV